MVGKRDAEYGNAFMLDVASRLKNCVQLTTDGHRVYTNAVENAFGQDIDYAMLVKVYGRSNQEDERRYSPVECTGAEIVPITGDPEVKHISTSYVERQNLTMRMSMKRFTRLTNGFSKKIENHFFDTALYFKYYNFGRIHKTLQVNRQWRLVLRITFGRWKKLQNLQINRQLINIFTDDASQQ
jgi:hypothetical protein